MKWSIEYSTGFAEIDKQHKQLFQMSEDYRVVLTEGRGDRVYGLLLKSLGAYARGHFGLEEGCMARFQCPAAQQNVRAHKQFVEALSLFQQRYDSQGFDAEEAQRLLKYIDQWLVDHICSIDLQLKPYAPRT